MIRLLAILLLLAVGPATAQNTQCSTRPVGDDTNACASTDFVQKQIAASVFAPQPNHFFLGGPISGGPLAPTFRAIVPTDLPGGTYIGTGQVITGAGTVTATSTDNYIVLNKSAPSATTINLPTVASRAGLVLEIYDYAGNGGNITINANGTDRIMGLASWTVLSGGVAGSGGTIKLTPLATVGWLAR